MNPTIKKAILFAVGAVSLTQEKISNFVQDLEKEGALNKEEGEELVKEFLKQSEQRTSEFRTVVEKEVRRVMNEMGKKAEDVKESLHVCPDCGMVCGCTNMAECECNGDCECEKCNTPA